MKSKQRCVRIVVLVWFKYCSMSQSINFLLYQTGPELRLKFILLINVKMPTIVGILTFISRINYRLWHSKPPFSIYFGIYEQFKFYAQLS